MFLGFKPSFWLTLQIIRTSRFVGIESRPSISWTPGVRFPVGPPSPGRARRTIDHGLHSVAHMMSSAAGASWRLPQRMGDGERFVGRAAHWLDECLGLAPGPVSDRLYREFRDWLRSEGGAYRTSERRLYRGIVVDAAGVVAVLPDEPASFGIV